MRFLRPLLLFAALVLGAGSAPAQRLPLPGLDASSLGLPASIDPLLGAALPGAPVQAVLTFDHYPAASDLLAIRATGLLARPYRALPMVAVQGTSLQLNSLPTLSGLRSIRLNQPLRYFLDESAPLIGAPRAWSELGVAGRGVAVAVIDSGIDATHRDLPYASKVVQNVKLAPDLFGAGPLALEGLADTDSTSGHGTHVASTAAGTGAALAGKYRGVAPGAPLVGVGAGEALFILTALEAFDWVLQNRLKYGIRVISNSWGTSGAFDASDPINVASRLAHDGGLVVVFAAGNDGPGTNTLNPYCVAPWVICVAAGHKDGSSLADFSSRGIPGDPLYQPSLTAPGVEIAAARATTGIVTNTFFAVDVIDLGSDAVFYAAASGTSMATPHVSGTVALMLEANPALTPDQVKSALQASATPMPAYERHEVGAGYLNAYGAVQAARGR
jgi:serine protease AprX